MNIMLGATALMVAMLMVTLFLQVKAAQKRKVKTLHRASPRVRSSRYMNTESEKSFENIEKKRDFSISLDLQEADEIPQILMPTASQTVSIFQTKNSTTTTTEKKIIVLYVMAQPMQKFDGRQLLPVLLAANLQYGEKQIFHRYAKESKKIIFSVAQATEPGVFDLQNIEKTHVLGLTFFLSYDGPEESRNFKDMFECVEQLAEALGGIILDQDKRVLQNQVRKQN